MACVGGIFAGTGRTAVRYRWAVLGAWAALTVLAMLLLPSLSSVTQGDNSSFLPSSAPSEQAEALAAPLQGAASLTAVTVVVGSGTGSLTGADEAAAAAVAGRLARVAHVVSVRDAGVSADGKVVQFTVLASLTQNVGAAPAQQAVLCGSLRMVHCRVWARLNINSTSTRFGPASSQLAKRESSSSPSYLACFFSSLAMP